MGKIFSEAAIQYALVQLAKGQQGRPNTRKMHHLIKVIKQLENPQTTQHQEQDIFTPGMKVLALPVGKKRKDWHKLLKTLALRFAEMNFDSKMACSKLFTEEERSHLQQLLTTGALHAS